MIISVTKPCRSEKILYKTILSSQLYAKITKFFILSRFHAKYETRACIFDHCSLNSRSRGTDSPDSIGEMHIPAIILRRFRMP
jgi:hypothetical protein